MVLTSPLAGAVDIDSAGTNGYHDGEAPDPRAIAHAAKRNVDLMHLRSRKITQNDFERFDYIVAMDDNNRRTLMAICPPMYQHKISLLLEHSGEEDEYEVPDPYHGRGEDFEYVLDLVESGCEGLLETIAEQMHMRGAMSHAARD